LEDLGVDGRIILKWMFKKMVWGVDWIGLAQERGKFQAFENAVVNLRIP
jgi:hypothetical protein